MDEERDEIAVTLLVTALLDNLGIPYVIAGGLASIIHGEVRTTLDVDLLADLRSEHVAPLAAALEPDFFVDAESIREAILSRRSFNAIHKATMFKVDVFVSKARPFDRAQLEHRTKEILTDDPAQSAWVASAEDTILAKLEWYEMGGRVSEKQWRDILGVVKTQGPALDVAYLRTMAPALGVQELLEYALVGAAAPGEPDAAGAQPRLF